MRGRAFWAIYLSVALSYVGVGLAAPLIAVVLKERGAEAAVVGLVATTMFASFTLASVPIGRVADRIGPKPLLVAGLVVYGAAILALPHITAVWLFFAARAVEGAGAAAISVATETLISQLSGPDERGRRMSYYAVSVALGWVGGTLAGALLSPISQRLPFIGCCALSLLAALLVAAFVPRTGPEGHHEQHLGGLRAALLVPASSGALHGYLMSSLVALIALYFKALNIPQSQTYLIITAVLLGTILAQVPIGWAADRFGKRPTLLAAAALLALVFAAMPSLADWRHYLAAGALAGALAGTFYPVGLAMIGERARRERLGAATSLFSLAFGVGSMSGPALSGVAMQRLGNPWLFYLPALLALLFALALLLTGGKGPRPAARG